MGFWEKVLPGYKGYREREDSRNSDKLLREFLTKKLREARGRHDDFKGQLAAKGKLDLLNPAEKVTQVLSRVTDRLRYANYGFSGKWFGKDKIGVEQLDRVHAFDQKLAERVDQLAKDLSALELLEADAEIDARLRALALALRELDEALNERDQILRTFGGAPDGNP
jgi:hypothetical protein